MRLGDIIEIKHGYAFSGEHIIEEDNNVVLVTPGNFKIGGGFQEKKCKFFDGEIPYDYLLKDGDFIVTMTDLSKTIDTLGYSALVPKSNKRIYLHNQRIGLVLFKNEICDRGYIYWLMRTHRYQREIANTSTGSTVHHTSPAKICDYEFDAPSFEVQHRIATILSRYDSLIENYQKQIKLLEEAAQRLYKEWFVDLHFPGHENTKIVDGVPEGWEKKKVGEIGKVITGKTPSTANKENYGGRIPFITIPDMHTGIYPTSSQFLSDLGANSQSGKFIPINSLMVSCIGTAGLVCITKEKCQTNQQINSLVLNDPSLLYYLYNTFLSLKEHLNNIGSNGATMTNVNKTKFESIDILIPTTSIYYLYNEAVKQSFISIKVLSSQIRLLTEARDRLLPKLMSGEIEAKAI
jgi:type I restriction enzyme S subunit